MTERRSSLLGKLTLRTKRSNRQLVTSASSSSSATTPDLDTPSTFSGPPDYGLGYSSINHERSPSYRDKRISKALQSCPIEFDRYADSSINQKHRTGSIRSQKLSVVHDEEHPLFVEIFHEAAPTPTIQSTVRAQSSSASTCPPTYADLDLPRPQSPFTITSSASQSRINRPPSRISPRRTQSADGSEAVRTSQSTTKALTELAAAPGQSFYAVGRGWKKGVYTTKEEAQRQIKNVSRRHKTKPCFSQTGLALTDIPCFSFVCSSLVRCCRSSVTERQPKTSLATLVASHQNHPPKTRPRTSL